MNGMKNRKCPECGVEYPLTRDYFYVGAKCIDGFRNPCKICTNKKIPHHPKIIDLNNKRCPTCGMTFPRTDEYFYKTNHNTWDNLSVLCKTCHNKKVKKWGLNNPEKVKIAKKKYEKADKLFLKKR